MKPALLLLTVAVAATSALDSSSDGQARQNPDLLATPSGFPAAFAPAPVAFPPQAAFAPAFFYRQFPDPNNAPVFVDPAGRQITAGFSGNILGFGGNIGGGYVPGYGLGFGTHAGFDLSNPLHNRYTHYAYDPTYNVYYTRPNYVSTASALSPATYGRTAAPAPFPAAAPFPAPYPDYNSFNPYYNYNFGRQAFPQPNYPQPAAFPYFPYNNFFPAKK